MTKRIMIVGAGGVFGARLVKQLVLCGFTDLILAGRKRASVAPLLQELGGGFEFVVFDRSKPDFGLIKKLGVDVIVDAAGPFQGGNLCLIDAAIALGVDYIDLADARDFLAAVPSRDRAAKAAGVAVISGASSTPAISHAVLDELTKGWQRINDILVAIAPGNRAPRGRAVIAAILSYVGEPIRVWRQGRVEVARGWALNETVAIAGVGQRSVALCETPDLDLLVARYQPRVSAEFKAGLELGIMHGALRIFSFLRAKRVLPNLVFMARPVQFLAKLLYPLGSDRGGMVVLVSGQNAEGIATRAQWSLAAIGGVGPNVPCLPALIFLLNGQNASGAYPASGVLRYADLISHLNRLGIKTTTSVEDISGVDIFADALGSAWDRLPAVTRAIHRVQPAVVLTGQATISGGQNFVARFLAKIFGFPEQAKDAPLTVSIIRRGALEYWVRHYPTRTMQSVIRLAKSQQNLIEERFGPFAFRMRLVAHGAGLDMKMDHGLAFGFRLPHFMLPRIVAQERVSADGAHLFEVSIGLPLIGRLVHYQGWLRPVSPA